MDVLRPLWYGGKDGGEHLYTLFQQEQAPGTKKTEKKTVGLQPTHAYILHIDHIVSKMCIYFFLF